MSDCDLKAAFAILRETFMKYSGKEGDDTTLTNTELAELLQKEFPNAPPGKVNSMFRKLDADGDGLVTFLEYVAVVADFKMMCSYN